MKTFSGQATVKSIPPTSPPPPPTHTHFPGPLLSEKGSTLKGKNLLLRRAIFFLYEYPANTQPLRKHAYSNILRILPPKNENFQMKTSDIFHISAQNIDCGYSLKPPRRGGSNEYPQSMFLSINKKNNVYPCKPQFYCIKVGFKGVKII